MMSKDNIKILNFDISDYAPVIDFWQSIAGVTLNESDTPEGVESFLRRNPGLSFIVKDDRGKIVGTILCGHNGRAGQIYHLAVAESHRYKGLGRRLVESCFAGLALENIPRCNVFVYSDNEVGNRFWLNTGWNDPATWKVLQKHIVRS